MQFLNNDTSLYCSNLHSLSASASHPSHVTRRRLDSLHVLLRLRWDSLSTVIPTLRTDHVLTAYVLLGGLILSFGCLQALNLFIINTTVFTYVESIRLHPALLDIIKHCTACSHCRTRDDLQPSMVFVYC